MPNWPGCEKIVGGMMNVRSQGPQVRDQVGLATEVLRDGGIDPYPCLGRLRLGKKCGQVLVGDKRRGRRVGLDWIGLECAKEGMRNWREDDDHTL